MKFIGLLAFLSCLAWSQTPPQNPAPPTPPAAAEEKGDTVIAIFEDGTKMTLDQFRAMLPGLGQSYLQAAQSDRDRFLHYYGLMKKLAKAAVDEKLDQKSPNKEALDFVRLETLTNIKYRDLMESVVVPPEELQKYYDEHKEIYKKVKVSAIYVAFGESDSASTPSSSAVLASHPAKKSLTEAEAKAKADDLVKQIRAGADFKKLVKENSDDETSRDKDGAFGAWGLQDNVPDLIRPVVFSLKAGEVGEPVRQAHGFYIFRADDVTFTPLDQVRDGIFDQLKKQHGAELIQKLDKETNVILPGKTPAPAPPSGK